MELIADILLVAGALGAGLYCFVLSRRLKRFTDLEKGVGGAVAVLSSQADELKTSLDTARSATERSGDALKELTGRAETVAQHLELMMASMHDVIPDQSKKMDISTDAPVSAEPSEAPEPAESVEPTETDAETESSKEPDATEPNAETTPARPPEGLMFFRHDRKSSEVSK